MNTTTGHTVGFDELNAGDDLNVTYRLGGETFVASGIFDGWVKRPCDGVWCMRLKSVRESQHPGTLFRTSRIVSVTRMNKGKP